MFYLAEEWAMRDQHPREFAGKNEVFRRSGAQSGALVARDDVLTGLIELWPMIADDARKALLAHAVQLTSSISKPMR